MGKSQVCLRCGYVACDACENWCDVLDEEYNLCCDGECIYPVIGAINIVTSDKEKQLGGK